MKKLMLATALLLATTCPPWAQSAADHDKHHPQQQDAAPAQPAPPVGQSAKGGADGMKAGGMMKMGGGGMRKMQMMGDARQPSAAAADCGGGSGMATIDRIEGRIAFLHAELKIIDAQASVWNSFAEALRANGKGLAEIRNAMMPASSPRSMTDRLALQEKWLTARLEGTRGIRTAFEKLFATLSDEQKATADELLAPHMGMSAMLSGMPGGSIGSGKAGR